MTQDDSFEADAIGAFELIRDRISTRAAARGAEPSREDYTAGVMALISAADRLMVIAEPDDRKGLAAFASMLRRQATTCDKKVRALGGRTPPHLRKGRI